MSLSNKVSPESSSTVPLSTADASIFFSTTAQSIISPSNAVSTEFRGLVPILSVKGGGIRGLIPALVLKRLEIESGMDIAKLFPVMVGTSTGGLVTCGLTVADANGQPLYNCDKLVDCYLKRARQLFPRKTLFGKLKGLFRVKYSGRGLYKMLADLFGNKDLTSITPDTSVVVVSYDLNTQTPIFFKSRKARTDPTYNFSLCSVLRATSAAPSYFKPAQISNLPNTISLTCVDGAVVANNPGVCALAEAQRLYPNAAGVLLVSLGCGTEKVPVNQAALEKGGVINWLLGPLLSVMVSAMNSTVDYQLRVLMKNKGSEYYDFDPTFKGDVPALDDVRPATLRKLKEAAEKLIEDNAAKITELAVRLREMAVQRSLKPKRNANSDGWSHTDEVESFKSQHDCSNTSA